MDDVTIGGVSIPFITDDSGRKMYQLKSVMEAAGFQRSSCVTRISREIDAGEKAKAEMRTRGTTSGTMPSCVVTLKGLRSFVDRMPVSMTKRHRSGLASVVAEMLRAESSPRPIEQMMELAEAEVTAEDEMRMQIANLFRRMEAVEKVVAKWK